MTKQRTTFILLGLILCLAAGLRLRHFDFKNPHIGRASSGDDRSKICQALKVADHNLRPERFKQPYYLIYTSGFLVKQRLRPQERTIDRVWRLTARSMIFYSVLTVFLTYCLARRLTNDPWAALLAALLMAVVPLDVIGSRYFKEDVPLMFYVNLALLLLTSLVVAKRPIFYVLAALAMGTAVAVKYVGALLIVVLVVAHLLYVRQLPPELRSWRLISPPLIRALAVMLAMFLIFNPYILFEWRRFAGDVLSQGAAVATQHSDGTSFGPLDHGGILGLRYALVPGLTLPVVAASALGMVVAVRRGNPVSILLLTTVGVWYAAVECDRAKPWPFFAKYLQTIVPALCAFAAAGLMWIWQWLACQRRERIAGGVLLALCVAVPLDKTILINQSLKNETREQAVVWMEQNLPRGSRVYVVDPHGPASALPLAGIVLRQGTLQPLDALRKEKFDYIAMSSLFYARYDHMDRDSAPKAHQAKAWLDEIGRECEKIREFRPAYGRQRYAFHNPVVRILRIPPRPPAKPGDS